MSEERWRESLQLVYSNNLTEKNMNQMVLFNPADAFAIYQLRDSENSHDHRFLPMSQLQATGLTVERENYELVYTDNLYNTEGKAVHKLLHDIFYRFNMERPNNFYGHSLSVSDIVALKVDGVVTAHYVDRYGWQELHDFLSDQPLRNVEMLPEDDFGMIDGIINNGKHEPNWDRPSVVKQLRKQPAHTPKTSSKGRDSPAIE